MTLDTVIGSVITVFGITVAVWAAVSREDAAYIPYGLFFAGLGTMFLINSVVEPGARQVGLMLILTVAMLIMVVIWWKLRRRAPRDPDRTS